MRILICTNAYPPRFIGGAELVAHEQARNLQRLGHEVLVFAGDLNPQVPHHGLTVEDYDGITVYRVGTAPEDYSPAFLNFVHPPIEKHFEEALRAFAPDILHCHNLIGLSVKLPILAHEAGVPVVCTLHDLWGYCMLNTAIRADGRPCHDIGLCNECVPRIHDGRSIDVPMRLRKDYITHALEHVDMFVAPSRHIASRYEAAGFSGKRIRVIPNGIDIERFQRKSDTSLERPVRISFIGHFGPHKGVSTLLTALSRIGRKDSVLLNLVGQGPEEANYRDQIGRLSIQAAVRFRGQVPHAEITAVYEETDVLVLPSLWDENQPVCIMEAMAAGIPVIATDKGGIPELITHNVNGLLYPAGDTQALTDALERLVAEPALCRTMGVEGRKCAEKRNHFTQAISLDKLYDEVVNISSKNDVDNEIIAVIGKFRRNTSRLFQKLFNRSVDDGKIFLHHDWITDKEIQDVERVCFINYRNPVLFALCHLGMALVLRRPTLLRRALLRRRAAHSARK